MAYTLSARFYDLLVGTKDYERASAGLMDLFATLQPDAVTLLDVGCGTGRHLEHFQQRYRVAGIDRSRQMLSIARRRCPRAMFRRADLTRFDLHRRFDIVTCLFGTIVYAVTPRCLRRAVSRLAAHVRPGGLLVIEPWIAPERFVAGRIVHDSADDGVVAVSRTYTTRRRRGRAVFDIRYVVESAAGVSRFSERHELGLFTDDEYREAIVAAGASLVEAKCELFGYGMYVATTRDRVHAKPLRPTTAGMIDATHPEPVIPVMRPRLPRASALLPYLSWIDAARIYSNNGPLSQEFEFRLAHHLGVPPGRVAAASSGKSALVGAVLAVAGRAVPDRPLALMPAFTFVAAAVAAEQAGFVRYLLDVDPVSWMLDPVGCLRADRLREVGVAIVVAPFGRAVRQAPWREWSRRTGIPLVIDGAAAFETVSSSAGDCLGEIPVTLSFHAAKSLGKGEGGCVVTADAALTTRASADLNYGFDRRRDSVTACTNGTMSEYHAAVGLAGLDGWAVEQRSLLRTIVRYRRQMERAGVGDRFIVAPEVCSSHALLRCDDEAESRGVQQSLRDGGIDYRHWYGAGLHRQPCYANAPHGGPAVTDRLAACILGLPMGPDLRAASVRGIVAAVRAGLGLEGG